MATSRALTSWTDTPALLWSRYSALSVATRSRSFPLDTDARANVDAPRIVGRAAVRALAGHGLRAARASIVAVDGRRLFRGTRSQVLVPEPGDRFTPELVTPMPLPAATAPLVGMAWIWWPLSADCSSLVSSRVDRRHGCVSFLGSRRWGAHVVPSTRIASWAMAADWSVSLGATRGPRECASRNLSGQGRRRSRAVSRRCSACSLFECCGGWVVPVTVGGDELVGLVGSPGAGLVGVAWVVVCEDGIDDGPGGLD